MYLSRIEEKMYDGEFGETIEKSIKILVAIGEIYNAKNLIPIKNAQISGVSYKTIGDAGLEWITSLKGKVKVKSFLNPCALDLKNKYFLRFLNPVLKKKQTIILNAFKNMGINLSCTCTPYYIQTLNLNIGDHISWGESSAVVYINSIYGCRTNREGGPSSLASAIIGKTPNYGLHLLENRIPNIKFSVMENLNLKNDFDYNILGLIIGKLSTIKIPLIELKKRPSLNNLKQFGSSMASSGCVPLYHIKNITAESKKNIINFSNNIETIELEKEDIINFKERYINSKIDQNDIDLVVLGCPHCSLGEMIQIKKELNGKKVKRDTMIFVSRYIYNQNFKLVKDIEKSNIKVFCDTCIIVSNICKNYKSILVNSGKAYSYIPKICNCKVFLTNTKDCIKKALNL